MAEYLDRAVCLSILCAKSNMAVLMGAAPYFKKAAQMLEKLPAADVAPVRHAKWVLIDECVNEGVYCSNCHKKIYRAEYANQKVKSNFCPNCGAKMDEEVSNDKTRN